MNCPGCGKPINIAEIRQYPERYYLNANMGAIWHDNCVRRVLKEWVRRNNYVDSEPEGHGFGKCQRDLDGAS